MKIHQLPLGARFEYEGEEFVKTGPMFATAREGGQRLIPKYAQLKVPGDDRAIGDRKAEPLTRNAVLAAFEDFYSECRRIAPEDRQPELAAARERFLKALGR
ncbi:MAG: hypothetical protein H6R10_1508 [Rhodocyclaceae bacterium]|nr:hypothetical protein [Rhodocyclaceae bacterium]